MTLTAWLSIVTICCLGAMSPGPSLAVVLNQTVNNGRGHGLAASWFHAAGVGLWAFATIVGLAVIVTQSPMVFKGVTWAGAAYLAWIGFKSLRAGRASALDVEETASVSLWQAGLEGAAISVMNPKLALFFLALFSQFVAANASVTDQVIMTATAAVIDGLWYSVVALVLSQGLILTALQKHSQGINRIMGIVLIGLAIRVITL